MSTKKNIQMLEKKRESYLNELLKISNMVRGSYKESFCRCGKPNCWCSDKKSKGHSSHRISWTKNSKSKTKSIPKEEVEWIKEMTGNYRRYRKIRSKLQILNNDLKILLDNLEEEIIMHTEKLKNYF